jgi:hypothetical protein
MLGEKVYNEQLKNLKKQKDRDIIVAKAWEHVTKNYANLLETDEMQFLREVMARIGESAPTHNLFQRIKTAIKTFLVKKGIISIHRNDGGYDIIYLNEDCWYMHPEWKTEVR